MAMNYDWDWSRADQEFQRALALEPNNPLIHDWYGEYLMATGRAEHAVHEMSVAAQLDPFSILINSDLGKMLYFARHYPEAKEQLSRAIRMDPAFDQPRMWMGYLLTTTGDFEEAINLFEKLWPVGRSNWQAALLGYTYGMAGKKSEAQQMLELVKNPSQHGGYADKLPVVWAYLGVGDNDRALACLEQDCQAHSTTVAGLRSLPWFDPLRADPRFVDLMRRVHLSP
jgi:tetratricopeptide (TPR) repeat protein